MHRQQQQKDKKKNGFRSHLCTLLNRVFYISLSPYKASTLSHLSAPQTSVLFLFSTVSIISELFSRGEWIQKLFLPGESFLLLLCFSGGGGATVLLNVSARRITCHAAESSLVPSVQGELRRLLVSISYGAERI